MKVTCGQGESRECDDQDKVVQLLNPGFAELGKASVYGPTVSLVTMITVTGWRTEVDVADR